MYVSRVFPAIFSLRAPVASFLKPIKPEANQKHMAALDLQEKTTEFECIITVNGEKTGGFRL
jgi:hypothetical protein